jgi:hypothetical protein
VHCGRGIYIKKYLKAKEECGNSHISPYKNIIFKNSSQRNQNPSRSYNSITNLKFPTQAKILSFAIFTDLLHMTVGPWQL